jgi:hypothetical protein
MVSSHRLSQHFIQMELSGFNVELNQNGLISREQYHLQTKKFRKLRKVTLGQKILFLFSPTITKPYPF